MFAVWLMFGVLGIPSARSSASATSNCPGSPRSRSSTVRSGGCPGILADRVGGRLVMTVMLAATPSRRSWYPPLTTTSNCSSGVPRRTGGQRLQRRHRGPAPWWPFQHQGFALGVFGAGNVGASVTKFIGPALIAAVPAAGFWGSSPAGASSLPLHGAADHGGGDVVHRPRHDIVPGQGRSLASMLRR